ncbi:hypothetical protein Q8A67_019619 [Cirrhinus molitorella]|uniref:Uncharacterized protein n=1 Tax=Cirrhinus molitorella TaxID=172907 RepID=A0AA88PB30_9TELE|nr:hypothetical protein Q8A67_019619 [Cirrhinus molitorella]
MKENSQERQKSTETFFELFEKVVIDYPDCVRGCLKQHLEKLECHFTWDLSSSKNELKALLRELKDVDQQTCTWLLHYYNLLGYIQHALGSNTEALDYLKKAENVMQEQETEEAGIRLQVNKANLAWIYFLMGDMDKSQRYLKEVEKLQQMYPAPPGFTLHPEVSGEKGWTLLKFNKSKKHQATEVLMIALQAEPERKEWHKGLAIAMSKAHTNQKCTPELNAKILKQLKIAHEKNPNSLLLHALYLEKLSKVQSANTETEMQDLLEKTLKTGNLEGLATILRYFRTISVDKAIQEAERVREKFPTSNRALKFLAICNKWKVYAIREDTVERRRLAKKSCKLFEEFLSHYPDTLREKVALASLSNYANNSERADEIYRQLVSDINDFPPPSQHSSLKSNLEKLECHFTWDLGKYRNELQGMRRSMQDVDQKSCTWLVHYYNLLGYIQQTLGFNTEALKYLHEAESVMQEQGTEEAGVRLQVNKANLAWFNFLMGEMDKSKGYLEEVKRLQQMHPAPAGCALHPEVSGEKGWTLVKFNKSKKQQAIDYFKMALKAEPESKEWHKGLAVAVSRAYIHSEFTPELEAEILQQVKTAAEIDPNDLFLQSLYILKKSDVQAEKNDKEAQLFVERSINTGKLEGLGYILEYFKNISIERAIQEGERIRKKFPTSPKVLRILSNLYKGKVYDSRERQILIKTCVKLFEKVVVDYPDCVRGWLALATLHRYADNNERAN